MAVSLYDPLTYENLMHGLVFHFEGMAKTPLSGAHVERVQAGPGIYALFYSGAFKPYSSISGTDQAVYVGKAVPPGRRKGGALDIDSPALRNRIRKHAQSIECATNLKVEDFEFRALHTLPVWISTAEEAMIKHYRPAWNQCLDGFGNHDPGRGRVGSERSWWDTLHPGRSWAGRLRAVRTEGEAVERLRAFFGAGSKP